MSDSDWKEQAVRQSSDRLDTDEQGSLPEEQGSSVDPRALALMADLHLIDALLTNLSERSRDRKEQRIGLASCQPDFATERAHVKCHRGDQQ